MREAHMIEQLAEIGREIRATVRESRARFDAIDAKLAEILTRLPSRG
jgi:hypothetical protein